MPPTNDGSGGGGDNIAQYFGRFEKREKQFPCFLRSQFWNTLLTSSRRLCEASPSMWKQINKTETVIFNIFRIKRAARREGRDAARGGPKFKDSSGRREMARQ